MAMLLVCLIWGINFSMMKFALRSLSPYALTAIRFTLASVVLWFVARAMEPDTPLPWKLRIRLAGLGVIGNSFYQLGFLLGLQRTTAGNSSLLIATTPLAIAVLGSALGVERLTKAVRWALAVGMAGVVVIVLAKAGKGGADGVRFSVATISGDLWTLSAVLCWAVFTHGVRELHGPASPLRVTAWTVIGGTPLMLIIGWHDLVTLDWAAVGMDTWGAVAYATFISLIVAYVLWNRSVIEVGSSRTALYGVTIPIFAMATAFVLLGERPTPPELFGAALILLSVVLNIRAHGSASPPTILR
jgi:drug/metabolite transporter (DMT)-like permease